MNVTFNNPPILRGDEAQQLAQLRDYLVAMTKQLNIALTSLDEGNFVVGSEAQRIVSGAAAKEAVSQSEEFAALRALIYQTADDVETQIIGAVNQTLENNYVALSQYGTDMTTVHTQIYDDAEGMTWATEYRDTIISGLKNYEIYAEGYIRAGIVGFNDLDPIFGIAVGRNIGTETVTVGDETYERVTSGDQRAVFTDDRLSFYQGEAEVAYLSNQKLYITGAHIIDRIQLGLTDDDPKWEINMSSGFSIKWLG